MSDDEIIAVVQAHKEGKQIQWSHRSKKQWYDFVNQPEWNFTEYLFRVKPEPRKPRDLWLQYCGNGLWQEKFQGLRTHFREVIEE